MTRSSAVTGVFALFCGEFGTLIGADVQLKRVPNRLFGNFQIPLDIQKQSAVQRLRRLQGSSPETRDDILHGLDGEVELRHEWSCLGQCEPVHERQDETPGAAAPEVDPQEQCIEEIETDSLARQIDFDLTCLGENLTCDDIENLDYHEELWSHCNQDPDMLYGECILMCRFGIHPTRRCTYEFDRANKYELSLVDGSLVWSHCALLTECDETTLMETMGFYCNKSAVALPPPQQIQATVGPLPEAPTQTDAPTPDELVAYGIDDIEKGDDEGGGVLIGVIGAAGGLVIGGLGVFALYKVLGKKAVSTGGRGGGGGAGNSGDDPDGTGHPSVVVGRPVTDAVSGAVAPPAGAAVLDDKGGGAAAGTPLGGGTASASTPKDN